MNQFVSGWEGGEVELIESTNTIARWTENKKKESEIAYC
jgi:hypothetical protein